MAKRKIISMIMCVLLVFTVSACEKTAGSNLNTSEDSPVAQEVNSVFAERGVKLGMTEDEVKAAETINFIIDTDPYSTYVRENYTHKTIYSESPVKYNDYDAVVIYQFLNDSLYSMEYRITVNYTDSEVLSTPAYAVFLDFTLKYTDMFGNPQVSETNNDTSLYTSYNNVWFDDENEENADYMIFLYTAQDSYQTYKDEYNNDVSITFVGNVV